MAIKSFKDKEAGALFNRRRSKKVPEDIQRRALKKLRILDAVTSLDELRVPSGNRLEALKGDRAGQHSIRINKQWRICFVWRDGDAYAVEIEDYH
jgi:proteic killer suppression protein